jgi:hypothetical protein
MAIWLPRRSAPMPVLPALAWALNLLMQNNSALIPSSRVGGREINYYVVCTSGGNIVTVILFWTPPPHSHKRRCRVAQGECNGIVFAPAGLDSHCYRQLHVAQTSRRSSCQRPLSNLLRALTKRWAYCSDQLISSWGFNSQHTVSQ